jgi:hypothetical protein
MRKRLILVTMTLLLAALACNLPGGDAPTPTGEITPSLTPELAGDVTPTFTQTVEAPQTATETPTATSPAPNLFNYKGFSFSYPTELFSGLEGSIVPAEPGADGVSGWPGAVPDQIEVKINGYPLKDTFHNPRILVYPIKVYADVNSAAGDISGRLSQVLAQDQFEAKNLPFLPMFNAGQMMAVYADTFGFQNGNGLRYLTCYTQAVIPINSNCLFYTYQGLTDDGNYYISAILPVSLPALETPEMKKAFDDATVNYDDAQYRAYLAEVDKIFAAAEPADYTPSLDTLDAVMRSMRAAPEVELKAAAGQGVVCPGAMAQRLQPDMRARVTFTDGTPLRVRQGAGKSAAVLGQLEEGATMVVTGGPRCANDGLWWQVRADDGGLEGWVLEGEKGSYYVEPWK